MQLRYQIVTKANNPSLISSIAIQLKGFGEQEIQVEIGKKRTPRSNKENRYLWGVVYALMADETGALPEDVHAVMKIKFLRIGGDKIPVTKSTASLSTSEFEDFASKVRMWASSELGIIIPLPNEVIIE